MLVKSLNFIGSILLGCYVVPMHYFVSNYPEFDILDTVLAMVLFSGIFLCVAGLLWLCFRDINKVSFFTYGFVTVFWASLPGAVFLRDNFGFFSKLSNSGYQWPLLFIFCLMAILSLFFTIKFCSKFITNVNRILSIFVFILSSLLLVNGCQKMFLNTKGSSCLSQNINKGEKIYPNVYHILLDAHPNQKAMRIIGGDLTPFYSELETLGFVTFPTSRSNYHQTMCSVASMLNMDYLEKDWATKPRGYFAKLIGNNRVFEYFRAQGFNVLFTTDNTAVKALYPNTKQLYKSSNQRNLMRTVYITF